MSNEKMKILEMIESKIISAEEGLKLLNALDQLENSNVISKETVKDVSEQISDSLEEANDERNEAFEEMAEELEEMAEEIEEEVDDIVEEIEESYEELLNESIDTDAEEALRAKIDEMKKKAEVLKDKVKIDIDLNGKTFKKEYYKQDFKNIFGNSFKKEFANLKRSFKGDMKSFNKDAKRFGDEMSKLGRETANITKDIVDDVMKTVNDIDFDSYGREFKKDDFTMDSDSEVRKYNLAQEFSIDCDGKKDISINVISTDVTLITEEREDILVNYINYSPSDEDMYKVMVEEDSKKVRITEKSTVKKGFTFNIGDSGRELLIRLPRKYKESLSVKTVSGDFDMNYLDSDFFRFSSVSGDITADIIYSVNSLIKTTSGDCEIGLFRGNMMFSSVSGDIIAKYESLDGDFTMKSVSGDAELDLPKNSEFEVVVKSVSGDVECEFPLTYIGAQKRGRLRGQVGSDAHSIVATTTSGDLNISRY